MIRNRFLPTTGIHNFRDYGGYPTRGGGRVKMGLLFRSGQHVGATDEDLAHFAAAGIRTVIDLRGTSERTNHPCRRIEGWDGEVVFHDGETTSSPPHMDLDEGIATADYARERMLGVYARMPRNPAMITMFARFLRVLDEREGASLVHCFAGKDRTGIAATLILQLLGVSRADQIAEFLLTNEAPTFEVLRAQSVPGIEQRLGRRLDDAALRALLGVHADYLERWIAVADEDHGSLDGYIEHVLGVDAAMRARLIAKFVE